MDYVWRNSIIIKTMKDVNKFHSFFKLFLLIAYIKMRSDNMASYKEIVTKAIIGKGKKYFKDTHELEVDNIPTTILGCWVINHKFKGYKTNDKIGVNGTYDVNIWYSYDNDSKTTVVNKKIDYNEVFNVKLRENYELNDDTYIIVRPIK